MKLTDADHIQGSPSAPIVLVEYADYQCPYCGQAYSIVKRLQEKFGDKLTFVFRNFPLAELHPYAVHAAMSAEDAAIQGKFWEMHDILFENQRYLDNNSLLDYAQKIGLDVGKFRKDFNDESILKKIEDDIHSGQRLGVEGTPTFFVNGRLFDGNWTNSEFDEYLESLI